MPIVNDDMNEENVHSSFLHSTTSNLGEHTLSPSDLAWADSCLNDDLVDPSNTEWSCIKDALFEILSSQAGPADPVAAQNNTQFSIDDFYVQDYVAGLSYFRESDDDEDLIDDGIEDTENIGISDGDVGNLITVNKRGGVRGKRRVENVFRPNYSEDMVKIDRNHSGLDLNLTPSELLESVSDDIFKVWDLGISEEQDDFTKQLEKVFSDPPPSIQPNPDNSTLWEGAVRVSVDDLVSVMNDLSLNKVT